METFEVWINGSWIRFTRDASGEARPLPWSAHEQCEACGAPVFGDETHDRATVRYAHVNGVTLACATCGTRYEGRGIEYP